MSTIEAERRIVQHSRQGDYSVRVVEVRRVGVHGAAWLELDVLLPGLPSADSQKVYSEMWSLIPDAEVAVRARELLYKGIGWCVANIALRETVRNLQAAIDEARARQTRAGILASRTEP